MLALIHKDTENRPYKNFVSFQGKDQSDGLL